MAARSASVRCTAASAALAGSTASRISNRLLRNGRSIPASIRQPITSTSNMFQLTRSATRVPTLVLATTSPLAASVFITSRMTVRET